MDEIRKKLDDEISDELENLKTIAPGTEEHTAAVESLATLYKLRIDETKMNDEKESKSKLSAVDIIKITVDGCGIVLPLIFYGVWMKRGLKFEETGTFTSTTFRGLFNKFKPTKV